jgi:putative ABC transport system permease protein
MDIANIWIRWMNNQWPIQLETNYITDTYLIIFLILLLITVSFLAGAYPSLYIARFQPSQILKGNYKVSGTNALTRFLLTWQFAFSVIAVFSGIVLWQNARYQENLDWGFDKRNVIIVPLANQADYEIYRNQVSSIPLVDKVAGTVHNVSFGYQTGTFDLHGVLHNAQVLRVGDNYLETLGLDLAAGREFLADSENDINESIIVNEKFIDTYDINEPLSTSIKMENRIYHIVGVVRDFYPYGLFDPVKPVIFTLVPEDAYSTLCVRADPSNLTRVNELLLKEWKETFPNRPYEGYFQESVANEAEMINSGILKQFGMLAIFALLLSSAGLFSLVSLSIDKKTKEIGIRKVMGASLSHIMMLINKEFLVILGIASFLGTAMGYYFMKLFLADIFTYHTSIGPTVFVITVTVIILMAFITSGRKIYRAAHLNPAVSLRYE